MKRLVVDNIDVSYGKTQVVNQVSFELKEGAIGCLLGPSGCGKTTVLLAVAGFQHPTRGEITINGEVVCSDNHITPPEKRNVGMVFQDYALFPNLNVSDNIRFGINHWSSDKQEERLEQLLNLVGMADIAQVYPHQLSGGQQQRVALARAMAPRPTILLLDEPFSNLDVELREQLAREVRHILKQEGISAILVTHDQHEAFAMADDICVMNDGSIQQQDNANNLYHRPANQFVANFIGEGVLLRGKATGNDSLSTALGDLQCNPSEMTGICTEFDILIRPEDVHIDREGPLHAVVKERIFRGSHYLYNLEFAGGAQLLSLVSSDDPLSKGTEVRVSLYSEHCALLVVEDQPAKGATS